MKGILFNQEMVQAILEGKKTVTRRVIKNQNMLSEDGYLKMESITDHMWQKIKKIMPECFGAKFFAPYQVGDILYVRETWQLLPSGFDELPPEMNYIFKATHELSDECTRWRPSIHMPKEAARIFLKVTNVRVERLQDMKRFDAILEGIKETHDLDEVAIPQFKNLWNSTIKEQDLDKYKWESNPWVWVVEFKRIESK